MKYSEYEALVNEALLNVDKAPLNMKKILENLKADTTLIESQAATIAEKDTKIKDLQDTNIKLFLGQTKKVEEEKEEKTGDEVEEDFIASLLKEE